jgi:hypothetical protein
LAATAPMNAKEAKSQGNAAFRASNYDEAV